MATTLPIGLDRCRGDDVAGAMGAEELEERGVAEVFFEVGVVSEVFGVDLRNGQAVATEVAGELEEGDVLFAYGVRDADGSSDRPLRVGRLRGRSRRAGPGGA